MKLTIIFFSFFRDVLGVDRVELDLEDSISLSELLNIVDSKFDGKLRNLIFQCDGSVRGDLHIIVNMNRVNPLNYSNIFLRDGDVVAFSPAPAGG